MKPHHKSEMLPYTGGPNITFRAYVGEGFKDTDLDVQGVLARHYEEKKTNVRLLDFSDVACVFSVYDLNCFTEKQRIAADAYAAYTTDYICLTETFINTFFAQEVEAAILLDLEQEYRRELGERGEVEAEDRNEKTAKQ